MSRAHVAATLLFAQMAQAAAWVVAGDVAPITRPLAICGLLLSLYVVVVVIRDQAARR